ncbi:MAG: hypothetical protein JW770_04500 [Actinobacteria bacterium]|nr:hypothetical protein [Actinomycetota bacterium]
MNFKRESIKVIRLLQEKGPITGRQLLEDSLFDPLVLWQTCNLLKEISVNITGNRYLRLDRRIEGYARLSPSILREFLTYAIIGLAGDQEKIKSSLRALSGHIQKVSRDKLGLSKEILSRVVTAQKNHDEIKEKTTFIIAGDIVYNMAHDELRPETSTGQIIKGSDLDIIIVTAGLSENTIRELDKSIYEEKYYLMKRPAYREEIDYIIKDLQKVKKQLRFDTFESMVASKILNEGVFLYGNMLIFENIKKMLQESGIDEKLKKMEETAISEREKAISYLLGSTSQLSPGQYTNLFYTREETEEIF